MDGKSILKERTDMLAVLYVSTLVDMAVKEYPGKEITSENFDSFRSKFNESFKESLHNAFDTMIHGGNEK